MKKALSRKKAHRQSLLRNLATSLILYEEIKTTKAKAKEVKPIVERLINTARKNDLSARRRLLSYLFDHNAAQKVFEVLASRYRDKKTGFVKIIKIGRRLGDNADTVIIKLEKIKIPTTAEPSKEKDGKKDQTTAQKKEPSKSGRQKAKAKK